MPVRKEGKRCSSCFTRPSGSDLGAYRGTHAYAKYPNVPWHEFFREGRGGSEK